MNTYINTMNTYANIITYDKMNTYDTMIIYAINHINMILKYK